ncbi:ATP-binding protein, partial [Patulibacter sp. NPDC049589]|uniref:ATP-binding protein n=1 Tax=Patulibacter sp. NPDC049589 TaxID=3154731 RepID=UPI00343ECC4D
MSAPPAERVRSRGGLVPGRAAVVAFSGGRDSLCLLDLAVAIVGADEVLAVHVHHGLRGRDADDEALRAAAT